MSRAVHQISMICHTSCKGLPVPARMEDLCDCLHNMYASAQAGVAHDASVACGMLRRGGVRVFPVLSPVCVVVRIGGVGHACWGWCMKACFPPGRGLACDLFRSGIRPSGEASVGMVEWRAACTVGRYSVSLLHPSSRSSVWTARHHRVKSRCGMVMHVSCAVALVGVAPFGLNAS